MLNYKILNKINKILKKLIMPLAVNKINIKSKAFNIYVITIFKFNSKSLLFKKLKILVYNVHNNLIIYLDYY